MEGRAAKHGRPRAGLGTPGSRSSRPVPPEAPPGSSRRGECAGPWAARRLGNTLPDLRQAWLAHRYLLQKMAEEGFTVDGYLHEKQMSKLEALSIDDMKPKRKRKAKPKAKA